MKIVASNWWMKVISQKVVGLIPGRLGTIANLQLARLVQGNISERPTAGDYRIHRSINNIRLLREHAGFLMADKHILEIGTGWRAADPLLFLICGADKVTTVDHAKWLTLESLRHSVEVIEQVWDDIYAEVENHVNDGKYRLEKISETVKDTENLDFILAKLNIDYRIENDADPTILRIAPNSVDLFYSESVLQRVPERKLRKYVKVVCGYLLKSNGAVFHRTDQRDIHTLQHVGNKDWALAYLRFPDWFFTLFLNGRFISQNRLRESDFVKIFMAKGISFRYVESRRHKRDLERIKALRLARRFREKSPEDVATRCSILIGTLRNRHASFEPARKIIVGNYDDIEC